MVRQATPPSLISQPDIRLFRKNDFEAAIWNKGYDVIIEKAIMCPCKGNSGSPKTSCQNCLGLGWVFINPTRTKALISSINRQTKYQQWSPEFSGTVNITVRDDERLAHMDRITFVTRTSILSEVRKVLSTTLQRINELDEIENFNQNFIFCSYKVSKVISLFLFSSDTSKLVILDPSKYSINPLNETVVLISETAVFPDSFNGVISIDYEHKVSYNVIDLPHDFRSTFMVNEKGQNIEYHMPIQGVARRSHLELGSPTNYGGNNLLKNDTE